jgi:transposase
MVHVSATCESTAPHLMTYVHTTAATVHEAQCTGPIQQALVENARPPSAPLVDAAYGRAELLVESQAQHGITLRGPTRPSPGWQAPGEGVDTVDQVEVDGAQQRGRCPQGNWSTAWWDQGRQTSGRAIVVECARDDCQACPARSVGTRAPQQGRRVGRPPQAQYEALAAARTWYGSAAGKAGDKRRAGVEGALSQGVRACRLRCARYRGLAKIHWQHVATAAAMTVDRIGAWLDARPRAQTRTARFAALAPPCSLPADAASLCEPPAPAGCSGSLRLPQISFLRQKCCLKCLPTRRKHTV